MMSGQHHENIVPNLQPGVRFYFSNVTTNGYVPFHWHSSLEIITVVKGHLRFTVNHHALKDVACEQTPF